MARKTIVFGNGLGMALDKVEFSLDFAIGNTWDGQVLTAGQRHLISRCLPNPGGVRPHGEDDLDRLQVALAACDFLNSIHAGEPHWLSEEGKSFPLAVRAFFYDVAVRFHRVSATLPETFVNPLADYLRSTQSHVATLNYDNLLYQPLIDAKVLKGYDGALCDGFYSSGFAAENLDRKFSHNFGFYLHLHGSPLFVDRGDKTIKLGQGDLVGATDTVSRHLVLTHVRHKPAVIAGSPLLLTYWRLLLQAFSESSEIMLVGYSGLDQHLNEQISVSTSAKRIRVVEWDGSGVAAARHDFWRSRLGRQDIEISQMPSILQFCEWDR